MAKQISPQRATTPRSVAISAKPAASRTATARKPSRKKRNGKAFITGWSHAGIVPMGKKAPEAKTHVHVEDVRQAVRRLVAPGEGCDGEAHHGEGEHRSPR